MISGVATRFVMAVVTGAAGIAPASEPTLAASRGADYSGGEATIFDASKHAYSRPIPDLSPEQRAAFFVGNSFFNQNWVAAPASTAGRDGLGPLFNTRSCSGCHTRDGRSAPPEPGRPFTVMLLRVSIPGRGPQGAPVPDPVYGGQIQGRAIPGVPAEADVIAEYETVRGAYGDGEPFELRRPRYSLRNPGYGAPSEQMLMSPRTAPFLIGLGLLEAVPEAALLALADPEDRNGDGISGRLNQVWDVRRKALNVGRFGWKAEQPTVEQQVAGAFNGDMGLTSGLFPGENHTPAQKPAAAQPGGGSPEVSAKILGDVTLYARALAVPGRREMDDPEVRRGGQLFGALGCAACHVPELATGEVTGFPALSRQPIRPHTDLLLHDLGDDLADHRPTFAADGREWRTAPLWGIGLIEKVNGHSFLLHDGRARNFAEAILWHGGEAENSREGFRALGRTERQALIRFLHSL